MLTENLVHRVDSIYSLSEKRVAGDLYLLNLNQVESLNETISKVLYML